MSYSLELLPDEPILIITLHESYNHERDFEAYLNEAVVLLDSLDRPVYSITDITHIKVNIFQDFITGFNQVFRGQGATINHPNIDKVIIVSTDKLMKLGAKGLNSATFGFLSVPVFDTPEEALTYARALIAQK